MYPPPTSQLPKIIPVVERIRLLLTTSEEYQRVALDVMDYPMATARKRQGIDPRPAVFIPGPQVIEVVVSVCAASTAADQVGQSSTRVERWAPFFGQVVKVISGACSCGLSRGLG
jgi:hypothetical protein